MQREVDVAVFVRGCTTGEQTEDDEGEDARGYTRGRQSDKETGRLRGIPFQLAEYVCSRRWNAGVLAVVPLTIPSASTGAWGSTTVGVGVECTAAQYDQREEGRGRSRT
jgi:hypothetical protein